VERATDEDLLGYTLGALEPEEHDRLEALVREDQRLQSRIEVLRNRLAPLAELQSPDRPPAGLARRTCERVAAVPLNVSVNPLEMLAAPIPAAVPAVPRAAIVTSSRESRRPPGDRLVLSRRRPVLDLAVGAAILLVLGALAVIAVQSMRHQSQIASCQDNMRKVGFALLEYARSNGGNHLAIPQEPRLAFAGVYGPLLIEAGLIDSHSLFYCRGAGHSPESMPVMPTIAQLAQADDSDLPRLQQLCGGDFAYNLGHRINGKYVTAGNMSRPNYALLADNPNPVLAGRRSSNHGGKGQNVFFEDGRIAFLADPLVNGDSIYENDLGDLAPGVTLTDCVLGASSQALLTNLAITE
jgi:hypothetical protein